MIIHVSRWGQSVMDHRCTVYLHKGGLAKVNVDEFVTNKEWIYDPITGKYKRKSVTYTRTTGQLVPNVIQLDTFSENICKYAEDAALTQSEVYVEYSGMEPTAGMDTGLILDAEIHGIRVTGNKEP